MIESLLDRIETPCFVVDKALLRKNLAILDSVRKRADVKILLAQKAFSMYAVYPLLAEVLDGTCASSPDEARLGREEFGKEVTAFAAGYSEADLRELLSLIGLLDQTKIKRPCARDAVNVVPPLLASRNA